MVTQSAFSSGTSDKLSLSSGITSRLGLPVIIYCPFDLELAEA
jgi:hypothetical protein